MNIKSLFYSLLCLLALSITLTSCESDEDDNVDYTPTSGMYILNQGTWGNNDASIAFISQDTTNKTSSSDIFFDKNNTKLGETGQDIIFYGKSYFVSISGSKIIFKLDKNGKKTGELSIPSSDGSPRYLAGKDGYIYASEYAGKVIKIDTSAMAVEDSITGLGANLEDLKIINNDLYVCNSFKDLGNYKYEYYTELQKINLKEFKKEKTIKCRVNPNNLYTNENDLFLISWGDYNSNPLSYFQKVGSDSTETIAIATKACNYKEKFYLVNSTTNWNTNPYTTTNTFFTYNAKTGVLTNETPFSNMPDELNSSSIYSMNINENTGEIYIATSNYTTNGIIYHFDKDGKFLEKLDSKGINPCKILFF